jgi:hypothetical protein
MVFKLSKTIKRIHVNITNEDSDLSINIDRLAPYLDQSMSSTIKDLIRIGVIAYDRGYRLSTNKEACIILEYNKHA